VSKKKAVRIRWSIVIPHSKRADERVRAGVNPHWPSKWNGDPAKALTGKKHEKSQEVKRGLKKWKRRSEETYGADEGTNVRVRGRKDF